MELAAALGHGATFESGSKLLQLIRISGTTNAPRALLVNPARGGLFIEPGPYNVCQTPLGVTCKSSPLLCHRERVNRSPLTGFGSGIARSGHYKQATPNGVLGQHTEERKDACKVQELAPAIERSGAAESGSKLRALQTLRDVGTRGGSSQPVLGRATRPATDRYAFKGKRFSARKDLPAGQPAHNHFFSCAVRKFPCCNSA